MPASKSLGSIKDREFENLTFDLLTILGIKNLIWRTPGADGGRDLQGEIITRDFSGEFCREVWYVECKVRKASLSWPDVFEKIAYAQNHDADSLLICCSSTLSPKCKDEINIHNGFGRRPRIRFWEGAEILQRVELQPALAVKYGLASSGPDHQRLAPLMLQGMKAIQAAYASLDGEASRLPNTLYLAQALSEFCCQFTVEPFHVICREVSKNFDDLRPGAELKGFDRPIAFPIYALKVTVAAVAAAARASKIQVTGDHQSNIIEVRHLESKTNISISIMIQSVLREISVLSNIEADLLGDCVRLKFRN